MLRALCLATAAAGALRGALAYRGGLAATVHDRSAARSVAVAEEPAGKSPVKRVVELLGKMGAELRAEADQESAMYDKMVCWCATTEKEKTQAVADAESKDLELSSEIESRSARFGNLATEITDLKEQISKDTEALKTAMAIREKAAAEFSEEEKDIAQAIGNLRNAISVLAKHHGGSLIQADAPLVSGVRIVLRDAALKYEMLRSSRRERRKQPRAVTGLLQTASQGYSHTEDEGLHQALVSALDINGASMPESLPLKLAQQLVAEAAHRHARTASFFQAGERQPVDADYKSYSARSTQIWGVLNQMLEEFNAQLSTAQKDELKAIEDYQALAEAKTAQITAGKEKLDDMEGDHSENQKALSDAKEDLDLTRKQRSADMEILRKLKVTCMDLDKDWERRSAMRNEELKAVTEAIAILTEDDNREMLAKSVSLLQEHESTVSSASASYAARRVHAVETLRRAAAEPAFEADDLLEAWHSRRGTPAVGAAGGPRAQLSALALAAQLDSFTEVKRMMDTMVAELKEQQKEEAEFKAYCNKQFDENEKATYGKNEYKGDLESKLDTLAALMAKLQKEIAEAKAQIVATEVEIKKASENREAENAEFQTIVADQRATQAILQKALLRLQDFYTKGIGKKVIYLQRIAQTPPLQFTKYKANAGSSPVMGLLEQIIGDSKALEAEQTAGEYKAQADYEQFTKDSNALIAQLSEVVASKNRAVAAAKLQSAETDADLKSTIGELESLAAYEADLHGQCDFVLKNFEIRQTARLQEMEAIQAAKAILSGAQGSR